MTSNRSSSSWTSWLRCSWSNQPGALSVILVTWSVITGTIANKKSATPTRNSTMTIVTATLRRIPRRWNHSTDGLRPAARNSETTMRISTPPMRSNWPNSQYASTKPRPPKKPM
jgi:hypothetical protein